MGSFSQNLWKKGVVITNNKDTLNGLIKHDERIRNGQVCVYKNPNNDKINEYDPSDIIKYSYSGSSLFETKKINGRKVFTKCYIEGEISLYSYGRRLFITKGNSELIELQKGITSHNTEDGTYYYDNYKELLIAITKEFESIGVPSSLKFSINEIAPIIIDYNSQSNSQYTVFDIEEQNSNQKRNSFANNSLHSFGFISAINIKPSSLNVSGRHHSPSTDRNLFQENWTIGGFFNYRISPMSIKYSIQAEIKVSNQREDYFLHAYRTHPEENHFVEVSKKTTQLRLPVSFQYIFSHKRMTPFASIGLSGNFIISRNINGTLELENVNKDNQTIPINDSNGSELNNMFLTPFLGLGVKYNLGNRLFFFAESRLEFTLNLDNSNKTNENTYVEYLELDYRYAPELALTQNSSFLTFNFGIGF